MPTSLSLAMERHEAGAFAEAAHLYREILVAQPQHADALHLLGVLMHQLNHSHVATELIGRAIQINQRFAPYHNNLGNALLAIGDITEARRSFKRSIALSRTADTYVNLGNLEFSQGEWAAAKASFQAALLCSPQSYEALFGLGNVAMAQGEHATATQWYEKSLSVAPRSSHALNALGNVRLAQGHVEGARASYLKAIECNPSNREAHINLGNVFMAESQFEPAIRSYEEAVRYLPSDSEAMTLLGIAHMKSGKQSIPYFEQALRLNPNDPKAHNALGVACEGLGEFARAAVAFEAALRLRPESVEYLCNVGRTMARAKDAAGIKFLERALQLNPDHIEAHWILAEILLSFGSYQRGFREYEWRWRSLEFSKRVRPFNQPLWDGKPLHGKVILLHAEQGYGDTIQFVRFIQDVVRLGGFVVLEVPSLLHRLLASLDGVHLCLRHGIDPLPPFDVHCPLMSLPHLLGTEITSIPPPVSLPIAPGKTALRMTDGSIPPLRVGLVWAGNPEHKRDAFRSMPLSSLLPLRDVTGVTMVCLQKNVPASDISTLSDFAMECPLADCNDFLDTANVICNVDLIVSVDTSVAHLAASMGKPVWLILPEDADWRWGMCGETTPWYPTMRLFRHAPDNARAKLVTHLVEQLNEFSGWVGWPIHDILPLHRVPHYGAERHEWAPTCRRPE